MPAAFGEDLFLKLSLAGAGGVIVGKYLNNQVAVTRALGNFKPCWGLKECKDGQLIGPLTAGAS